MKGGEWTLFAPVNDAFIDRFDDIEKYLGDDAYIMNFHIIKGKTIMFDDLICTETIATESYGEESRTKCAKKGAQKFQTGRGNLKLGTMPKIITSDVLLCNGVIHGVDDIILPKLILKKESSGEGEDHTAGADHTAGEDADDNEYDNDAHCG